MSGFSRYNSFTSLVTRVFIITSLVIASSAYADQYHYINQIVGHRALGLGGAYTGISDDPAGLFYNPAGIVYAPTSNVSASVNTFQLYNITYKDALAGEFDWERNSLQLLPNFFGVIQPLGKFKVDISSSTPDSVLENQDQQFDDFGTISRFIINLNNSDITYNFGPSIAMEVNDSLAIGLNLHYHFRKSELNQNQYILFKDGKLELINTYFQTSENGIRPKLGIMWSPIEKLSVGLTIDKTLLLKSATDSQGYICETDLATPGCSGPNSEMNLEIQSSTGKRTYPIQYRLGLAYFPTNTLLISSDIIYHTATANNPIFTDKLGTFDVAIGSEWYMSSRYALRAGFFTSNANTPEIQITSTGQEPHINQWGLTSSLSRFSKGSSVTVGAMMTNGQGESQLFGGLTTIEDTAISGFALFVSTSYSY